MLFETACKTMGWYGSLHVKLISWCGYAHRVMPMYTCGWLVSEILEIFALFAHPNSVWGFGFELLGRAHSHEFTVEIMRKG